MRLLSNNVKDIKDVFEKSANADNIRSEKFGNALNNLSELIQNFSGLVEAVQKSNADQEDSSDGPVQGIRESLEGRSVLKRPQKQLQSYGRQVHQH